MAEITVHYDGPLVSRSEASARGEKRYFTGKPCPKMHVAEHLVSNYSCCACRLELWGKSKESVAAYNASYKANNRERLLVCAAAYRAENKDRIAARDATYFTKNRDRLAAYSAGYRARKRDRITAYHAGWRERNPDKVKANMGNRRARERAAEGSHTAAEIQKILKLQRHKCAYCRVSLGRGYHVDHIIPLARGGSNYISNIQLTCQKCNVSKRAIDPMEYARRLGRLL